ncbi:MAG: pyridoxal-phosphate dependent enzyme [Polyangia bacterium]
MIAIPESARTLCRTTPLIWSAPLGCHLKLESHQRSGSVLLRGAALKLARMPAADRAGGVITASTGNLGAALACVGQQLGVRVRVIMPEPAAAAPRCKRELIAGYGGEIIRHGRDLVEAERFGRRLAAQKDALFISPSEDSDMIEGTGGWLGHEVREQLPGVRRIVTPVGSGGTAAGLLAELGEQGVEILGVSAAAHAAMADSLLQGRALTEYTGSATACEELTANVGWRSFRSAVHHALFIDRVSEEEAIDAVVFAYRELGLVIEPSAAVVLAAVRAGRLPGLPGSALAASDRPPEAAGHDVVLIISGGNLDAERLRTWLGEPELPPPDSGAVPVEIP